MRIAYRLVALAGLLVVAWACVTAWGAVVHGHPAYAVLLGLTLFGSLVLAWWSRRADRRPRGWRLAGAIALVVGALLGLAVVAWLRPFTAQEPALGAMASSPSVEVIESATEVVLRPTSPNGRGLLYQPGAKVEARAYAAVLRPLAEAGITVVIPKQPLAIAFLAANALDGARAEHPDVSAWVVGGHSLGGTVASGIADGHDGDVDAPVVGLLLHASYPASDVSATLIADVLSISGTEDGLATPADIEASAANLPPATSFLPLDGVVHAFFGDYGPQPGDGQPGIPRDEARALISEASEAFVGSTRCPECE